MQHIKWLTAEFIRKAITGDDAYFEQAVRRIKGLGTTIPTNTNENIIVEGFHDTPIVCAIWLTPETNKNNHPRIARLVVAMYQHCGIAITEIRILGRLQGFNPLWLATVMDNVPTAEALLKHTPARITDESNIIDSRRTTLHYLVRYEKIDMLRVFSRYGASNFTVESKQDTDTALTSLVEAVQRSDPECVRILVFAFNADPSSLCRSPADDLSNNSYLSKSIRYAEECGATRTEAQARANDTLCTLQYREREIALAMALHPRLGEGSVLSNVPPELIWLIIHKGSTRSGPTPEFSRLKCHYLVNCQAKCEGNIFTRVMTSILDFIETLFH